MSRQFKHLELSMQDALALHDKVKPLQNISHVYTPADLIGFCKKLYAALIDLEGLAKDEGVNIPLTESECMIINHCVDVEEWEGSKSLLRATWAVLFEWEHDIPPSASFAIGEILNAQGREQQPKDALS